MRNNQPVTNVETTFPDGVFIYSRTDLKGRITEANKTFAEISGFTQEEMLGEPHNLIRHPDMPVEAFADLWKSLKEGRPWKGLVKNRRKDGGYYWVVANASPVREDGAVVGYQSVRTKPTREQIAAAEAAYKRIREGDKSIRIQQGRVVKNHSPLVERLIAHETRLYGFVLLALITEITGIISENLPSWRWLASAHDVISFAMLACAVYMLLVYLPKALGRLRRVDAYLEKILVSGDLAQSLVPAKNDVIGKIAAKLDTQMAAIRATLQIMIDSSREVAEATDALDGSVTRLASSTEQQSSATSAAAAGVEEMTVSIGEVAQHAKSTQSVAEAVGVQAQTGADLSQQASDTIQALADTVAHSAETVEQLGVRTDEVGKVASVIKEIADQTNLLALNAAIEAARAGEMGRGFAVVADEVRKLAERTTNATREIDQMIHHIQADTRNAVDGMRASAGQVNASVELVRSSHDALERINEQMQETLHMVSGITHSSSEQNAAMQMMAQTVEQVSRSTDDNLAVAHNTEASSHQLQKEVGRMRKAVQQYKV